MLIRHAEKPDGGPPFGVTESGSENKRSITVRGWQRAGALASFFARPARPKIATPDTIFAAAKSDDPLIPKDDAKSLRPLQSVAPLASRLGCTLHNEIAVGEESKLVSELQKVDGTVLVAWEHKRIPAIAGAFVKGPPSWRDDVFDEVWVLDRNPDGSYTMSVVKQDLLAGDTA